MANGRLRGCSVYLVVVGLLLAVQACAREPSYATPVRDATGRLRCPSHGFVRAWAPESRPPTLEHSEYRGVILPESAAVPMLCQCSRQTLGLGDSYWTPTPSQIAELEARLPGYLLDNPPKRQPDFWQRYRPRMFLRQYLGVVRAGRARIAVKFELLSGEVADFSQFGVGTICDGGPRHFGVEYDMGDENFVLISYNGAG